MSEQRYLHYPPRDIDPTARALIRHKAAKLRRCSGINRADLDDIQQELALKAHVARLKYDPARGNPTAFYNRVLTNRLRTLATHATAQKRDRRRETPLDVARVVAAAEGDPELKLDVAQAVASLSDADQLIASLLSTNSLAGVVQATGATRGIVRQARRRIAGRLKAAGLDKIFHSAPPFGAAKQYLLDEGESHSPNSRRTGRKAKDVGVHPSPDALEACLGKGAP